MPAKRPCIDCSRLTTSSRCADCRRAREAKRWQAKADRYNGGWRKTSRQARIEQPFCSRCGSPDDLVVDHRASGGSLEAGIDVLCRRCNAIKANTADKPAIAQKKRSNLPH